MTMEPLGAGKVLAERIDVTQSPSP